MLFCPSILGATSPSKTISPENSVVASLEPPWIDVMSPLTAAARAETVSEGSEKRDDPNVEVLTETEESEAVRVFTGDAKIEERVAGNNSALLGSSTASSKAPILENMLDGGDCVELSLSSTTFTALLRMMFLSSRFFVAGVVVGESVS